jgi:hypothetical protein
MACDSSGEFSTLIKKYGSTTKRDGKMEVESNDFAIAITAANRLDDIIWLAKAIYSHVSGKIVDFDKQPRQPCSPFFDFDEQLAKENVSADEIEVALTDKLVLANFD